MKARAHLQAPRQSRSPRPLQPSGGLLTIQGCQFADSSEVCARHSVYVRSMCAWLRAGPACMCACWVGLAAYSEAWVQVCAPEWLYVRRLCAGLCLAAVHVRLRWRGSCPGAQAHGHRTRAARGSGLRRRARGRTYMRTYSAHIHPMQSAHTQRTYTRTYSAHMHPMNSAHTHRTHTRTCTAHIHRAHTQAVL